MKGLTPGRIVHYVTDGGNHRPAIIVNTREAEGSNSYSVAMTVFLDAYEDSEAIGRGTSMYVSGIPYDEGKDFGTWHWIEPA